MQPEVAHQHLTLLLKEKPQLEGKGQYSTHHFEWLGRAVALVHEIGDGPDIAAVDVASQTAGQPISREFAIHTIVMRLHALLAQIDLKLPVAAQGAFIAVGAEFSAFRAVSKVFAEATLDLLVIDPYLNEKVLSDFLLSAPEKVCLRLIGDQQASTHHAAHKSAAIRWSNEYGMVRPLQVRITQPRVLHDRLILVDCKAAWSLTQSFKDLANRSPASLMRASPELAGEKIHAYEQIWASAASL